MVADIVAAGGKAVAMAADVGNVGQVEALVAQAASWLGGLDILVNNAGVGGGPALGHVDEAAFDRYFDVNVKGLLFASQAAAALMPDKIGTIINIGSLRTRQPGPQPLYSATKGAVMTMTISLARALSSRGIRVNSVAPGAVNTEIWAGSDPQIVQALVAMTPLRRLAESEEIAAVVAFLASDDASYITGETIPVGGGIR